jgi:hypothetical protein
MAIAIQEFYYFQIIILSLLALSFYMRERNLTLITGFLGSAFGVFLYNQTITNVSSWFVDVFTIFNLGVGFFFIITIVLSIIEKNFNISIGGFANDDDEDW